MKTRGNMQTRENNLFADDTTLSFSSPCSGDECRRVLDMWVPLADFRSLRGRKVSLACSTLDLSEGDGERGGSEEEPGGRPPDGSLMLGGLQQASVVGHDLVLMEVQVEL